MARDLNMKRPPGSGLWGYAVAVAVGARHRRPIGPADASFRPFFEQGETLAWIVEPGGRVVEANRRAWVGAATPASRP